MSRHIIKKGLSSSIAILISRFVGLIRDMLMSRFIGGGAVMSAWIIAFRIPNTFRGFFGEGVSTQALVPMLQQIIKRDGEVKGRREFGAILATIGLLLGVISILVSTVCIAIRPMFEVYRVNAALGLMPILMPYCFFICLTGICAGILNMYEHYFIPALSSVIMNLFMIFGIVFFYWETPEILINRMSWAVLISGVVQLWMMFHMLKKVGIFPYPLVPKSWKEPVIQEFIKLTIPGLMGTAAYQISVLMDSFIAVYISNHAAPALYYSERLVYLPIGIIAVSMGNASLVSMSRQVADGRIGDMLSTLAYGLRQIYYLTVPMAAIFLFFRYPIIDIVYSGDKFDVTALNETAWALMFYCLGIPSFCSLKVLVSAFYSRKDMKTPVKIAVLCLVVNFILNLILMWPLKQGGIALATVISSILNCSLLTFFLRKKFPEYHVSEVIASLFRMLAISGISGALSWGLWKIIISTGLIRHFDWHGIVSLTIAIGLFYLFYFTINFMAKSYEQKEWMEMISGRLGIGKKQL